MKAKDIDGNNIFIGDVVEVADNSKPTHGWLREGNRLEVISIEDRSFQGEEENLILFFRTIAGGRKLSHGIGAKYTRKLEGESL